MRIIPNYYISLPVLKHGCIAILSSVLLLCLAIVEVQAGDVSEVPAPETPTKPKCGKCEEKQPDCEDGTCGDPFYLHNGDFFWEKQYLAQNGTTLPFHLKLHYSVTAESQGPVGNGWVINYGMRVFETTDGKILVRDEVGRSTTYTGSGGTFRSTDVWDEVVVVNGDGSYTLTKAKQMIYQFDAAGKLVSIRDGKGSELRMSYYQEAGVAVRVPVSGVPRFSNRNTPAVVVRDFRLIGVGEFRGNLATGRQLTLNYDAASGRLTGVSDHSGQDITLTYDGAGLGDLTEIMDEADLTSSFTYDEKRLMRTYMDAGCSDCGIRTNTYDDENRIIKQLQGASGEGEEIDVVYTINYTDVTYKIKNSATGDLLRTRQERVTFVTDNNNQRRVSKREIRLGGAIGAAENLLTIYSYKPANPNMGKIIGKTEPGKPETLYEYDANGNQSKITRVVSTGVNLITDRVYDAGNRVTHEEIYYSNQTTVKFIRDWEYDTAGRLKVEKQKHADGTFVTTGFSYYTTGANLGLLQTKTDPRGNATTYEYTTSADVPAPVGLLKREYDPARPVHQTLYTYDARGNCLTVTDALGRVTTWEYNAMSEMTREIRPDLGETVNAYVGGNLVETKTGNLTAGWRTTRYRYNGLNQKTSVLRVNDSGQEVVQVSYEYDSQGNILRMANALGQVTTYEYDLMGWQTKIKQPYTLTQTSDMTFIHDKVGRVTSQTDAIGTITETTYDFLDRPTSITEAKTFPEQRTTEQSYDAAGNVIEIRYKDAVGTLAATTKYYYDRLGRKTGINWNPANASPDGTGVRELPQKMEYDNSGNLTATVDGRGNRTTYLYDTYNRQTKTQFADRLSYTGPRYNDVEVVYDEVGNFVSTVDGRGTIKYYQYDSMDRKIHESVLVTTALTGNWWNTSSNVFRSSTFNCWGQALTTTSLAGGSASATYDAFGRASTQTDAAGLSLTYTYNAFDQPIEIQYPALAGQASTKLLYAYNPFNAKLVDSTTDRAGNITSFSYDILLRSERTRRSLNQPAGLEEVTVFDRLGRTLTVTNEVGNVTTTTYDVFDQILNVTLPDHTVANPRNQTFTYDPYGQQLTQSGAGDYPVTYTYDLAGNRLTLVTQYGSANTNQTTTWTYNARNRVSRKTFANTTFYDYTYDENGNLKTRKDAKNQTTTYSYNLFNQVGTVDYPADSDVVFTYDSSGRRLSMTDGSRSGGPSAEWTYDAADRIANYKQHPVDRIISYAYNAEGGRTSMSVEKISVPGSPWLTAYTYDAAGRMDTLTDGRMGSVPFDYTWDPNANLVREILMPSGAKQQKAYDALARLSEIKALNGSAAIVNRFAYTYNEGSQRKDVTLADSGKITYGYDDKRQLTSAVKDNEANYNYSYTFDNIGNWLTGKTGQLSGAPLSKTFTPNNLNQYSQVSAVTQTYDANASLTNDGTRTYTYDQENRLTAVATASFTYDGMSRRVASGAVKFLYDGLVPIAELDTGNNYTRTVTRGLDIANTFQETGGIGGVLATVSSTVSGCYFYDGNGNVVDVLDASHAVVANYAYDPFGNKVAESGSYASQPYQWSTKEFDSTSGLVYYLYRFYNPKIGRWLSRDPVEERGGLNILALLSNDPANGNDVNGLANYSEIAKEWFLSHAQGAGYDWAGPFPGTPLPLAFIPGCPFLQIIWTASINVTQCCDRTKGERGLMYNATGGIEAYLQWGKHWKWSKHDTKFGRVESGTRHPNKGFRDRKGHVDVAAKLPDCPKEIWEWKSWTLTVFLRATVGTGIGRQINISTSVSRGQDFSWETLWNNANVQGSVAWGVAGLSVEIGGSGSVTGVGRIR